jgi:hypothetical protein
VKRSLKFYLKISQKGMDRIPIHRDELTEGDQILIHEATIAYTSGIY